MVLSAVSGWDCFILPKGTTGGELMPRKVAWNPRPRLWTDLCYSTPRVSPSLSEVEGRDSGFSNQLPYSLTDTNSDCSNFSCHMYFGTWGFLKSHLSLIIPTTWLWHYFQIMIPCCIILLVCSIWSICFHYVGILMMKTSIVNISPPFHWMLLVMFVPHNWTSFTLKERRLRNTMFLCWGNIWHC